MADRWKVGAGIGVAALGLGLWLYNGGGDARSAHRGASGTVATEGRAASAPRAGGPMVAQRADPAPVQRAPVTGPANPAGRDDGPASPCSTLDAEDCSFLEPDPDTLDEMARCGIVRYEIPAFLDHLDDVAAFEEQWMAEGGLTSQERLAIADVAEAFRTEMMGRIVALAVEVGLEPQWAEQTPMLVAIGMVQAQLDDDAHAEALATVARERAGVADPPTTLDDAGVAERAARLLAGTGDDFEDALASALGPARAAELRKQRDGWPGATRTIGNKCPVEPPPAAGSKTAPRTPKEAQRCIDEWQAGSCRFSEPNPLLLDAMAKCGTVRFDFPTFMMTREADPTFEAEWVEGTRLSPSEIAALAEAGEAVREALYRDVTELALEVGKTRQWAQSTPLMGLMMALQDEVDDDSEIEAVFRQIAKERAAGIEPPAPSADTSVHERFIRRIVELGPTFEAAVGARLGAARAHQLREHADGWPSTRVQSASRC